MGAGQARGDDHAGCPKSEENDGGGVDEDHFGKLKKLGKGGIPDEGKGEEEKIESVDNGGMEVVIEGFHKGKFNRKLRGAVVKWLDG